MHSKQSVRPNSSHSIRSDLCTTPAGAVEGRKLLSCIPSASTVATVDKVTAEAIASTLSLALAEVVTCQGANEYDPVSEFMGEWADLAW